MALDVPTAQEALRLCGLLSEEVGLFKIGLQSYTAEGPALLRSVSSIGPKIFLDLKLHDIPNTVGKAVEAASKLGVRMLTLHLSGGTAVSPLIPPLPSRAELSPIGRQGLRELPSPVRRIGEGA